MDVRRLHLLLELSRLGSMRAVAETHGLTTSTVSQQIAALAREVGTPLVEPEGRRVRLTPAGHRLADHAVTILAAVDAAQLDLDPGAEPAGRLRIGGFATAIRASLLPIVTALEVEHPQLEVLIHEYEPGEALALLGDDDLDLALTYDYNLAPASPGPLHGARTLWSTPWGLGVPADEAPAGQNCRPGAVGGPTVDRELTQHRGRGRRAHAGVPRRLHAPDPPPHRQPRARRRPDPRRSRRGLLPVGRPTPPGVRVLRLPDPGVVLTTYAVTRLGRENWSPLRLLLDRLVAAAEVDNPYLPVVSP